MKDEIKVTREIITPQQARELLKNNAGNRHKTEANEDYLYQQMKDGNWQVTGDTHIKIAPSGRLLNGQHTLNALIRYGKPLEFFVARNVPEKVFAVLDTGRARQGRDIMSIEGFGGYSTSLAAILKSYHSFKHGRYSGHNKGRIRVSNADLLKTSKLWTKQELHDFMKYLYSTSDKFRYLPVRVLGLTYLLFSEKNQKMTDDFFEKLVSGVNLSQNNPIRLLREKSMRDYAYNMRDKKRNNHFDSKTYRDKLAIMIMAWNAFRDGKPLKELRLEKNYKFPTIK